MIKLTVNTNHHTGETYYYAQYTFRDAKGVHSKTVKNIGKHTELLKITPDPLSYAKQEVRKLDEEYKNQRVTETVTIDYATQLPASDLAASRSTALNIGYFYLQYVIGHLKLKKYCNEMLSDTKVEYNAYDIHRALLYSFIIRPGSKKNNWENLGNFFGTFDFEYHDILRYLDRLAEHFDSYIEYLFDKSNLLVHRNTDVCYYDCTNFFFEIEKEDPDYIDEVTGEVITGLRKYGVSKEHRPNPIVEMGLFMDGDGIPISMCLHSGNKNEQTTAIPAEKKIIQMFDGRPFIYCSDGGLGSYHIRRFNSFSSRQFIVTQSIRKCSSVMQSAVFDNTDYRIVSNDTPVTIDFLKTFDRFDVRNRFYYDNLAYKVIVADVQLDVSQWYESDPDKSRHSRGKKTKETLKQYMLVTFSRKTFEYQRYIRNNQIMRARQMLNNAKDPEEIKKGPNDIRRFIKLKQKRAQNLKVTDIYEINQELIESEEKYDGFYALATNIPLLNQDGSIRKEEVNRVLTISKNRNEIEAGFRVMKTNFSGRPVFLQTHDHIKAHFLLCFSALVVYKILEKLLDTNGTHYTVENVLQTIRNAEIVPVEDKFYVSSFTKSGTLDALAKATKIVLDKQYYRKVDLERVVKKIF